MSMTGSAIKLCDNDVRRRATKDDDANTQKMASTMSKNHEFSVAKRLNESLLVYLIA